MTFPFPTRPRGGIYGTATTWSPSAALNSNGTGDGGISFRQVITGLSVGGDQARVTVASSTAATLGINNISIAKVNVATAPNCDATPVELKFAGVSGVSLGIGATGTSDWTDFRISANDTLMVIIDFGATANPRFSTGNTNITQYSKAATASYASATVSGFSSGGGRDECIVSVEIRKTQ